MEAVVAPGPVVGATGHLTQGDEGVEGDHDGTVAGEAVSLAPNDPAR